MTNREKYTARLGEPTGLTDGQIESAVDLIAMLDKLFVDPATVQQWLYTPHPDLGGRTAATVIREGHAPIVLDMIEAALAGIPS